VRRLVIQKLLPACFCLVPILAAALVAAAVPPRAALFYLKHVRTTPMDWLILGLGLPLFLFQIVLAFRALQWRGDDFDHTPDRWLSHLAQAAEWFPLLGLIGTVAGILQTFSGISERPSPHEIITLYAPAITATGSGLFMALFNILPSWVVLFGRDLILALGGGSPTASGDLPP
jgi:hypothetical protein